ncbi:MAG: AmmeMemoRadiSam system protein A, partial [Nitrospinaceae bacterium]
MVLPVHPSARLAMDAVWHFVLHGTPLPCPEDLAEELKEKLAAFVSIKNGDILRGCIGSLHPARDTLAEEIIHFAGQAAGSDPRFQPVGLGELPTLTVSVDVISPLQPADGTRDWDTSRFGLAVQARQKQGVLLPDQPGITRPGDQLKICLKKGGISPGESYEMYRFTSNRFQMQAIYRA